MTRHRVLILAQGGGTRWDFRGKPFLGLPKQLVEIDGETLLARARRLFAAHCEVIVIAPDDDRFGKRVTLVNPFPTGTEQDKFLGTRDLWNQEGRTIIAWGDCYYTDDAVQKIISHPSNNLQYFRRPWASEITGHKWDESFAVSFGPHEHQRVLALAETVVEHVRRGYPRKDHIRTHYAASLGVDLDRRELLIDTPGQTIIDDWSDDFDRPDEWCRWVGRYYKDKINICTIAPYRPGNPWREKARMYVEQKHGPIIYGTCKGDMFNRSAARNAAINKAFEDKKCEVVFSVDTDTFVPNDQMTAAAYLAKTRNELVLAFSQYVKVDQKSTLDLYVHQSGAITGQRKYNHASGAVMIPRGLWKDVGGFDERFVSWGGEDRAFWLACNALRGRLSSLRVPGDAYHLFHPLSAERDKKLPEYQANIGLAKRYKRSAGIKETTGCVPAIDRAELDKDAMLAILNEPGGPHNMRSIGELYNGKMISPELYHEYQHTNGRRLIVTPGSSRDKRMRKSEDWERV